MKKVVFFIFCIVTLTSCFHRISKVFAKGPGHAFGKVMKSKDNEYRYTMGEQYYANKKYSNARQLFEDLFPFVKGTQRYEDMYYKVAYCYFYEKDYLNAENFFKTFTETFPGSSKSEECEYMRAFCFYKQSPKVDLDQTNTTKAISLMQAFINTHPGSPRIKDANDIIDKGREKLELKEYNNAELYYNLGYYKASAIAFGSVSENFPDSKRADEYKLQVIRSYFKYAELSTEDKQTERFEKVVSECNDFSERFTDSKLLSEVTKYKTQSTTYLKNLKNEQIKKAP
ncbi:outer membrane protein assembly factor BamD [mine drainage metagenome]|uniref:Outer membrane protein assembly factor BamD n=1 Tax=mine drainage metagenome TaxID=410659 RepID=A0A1J5SMS9_9ZZZZ